MLERSAVLVVAILLAAAIAGGPTAASGANAAADGNLARRSGARSESYPGVVVRYDSVRDAADHRLRLIETYPRTGGPRFPTVFVVGWLSCDSVEAPPGTHDASQLVMQAVIRMPGFATVRLDKPGVGDSEGDCATADFVTELAAYRQALRITREASFADPERIFLFGMSNGGGFAPLVAETTPVRGYVVVGGWIKTWFEHMLEIERRRLALAGHPAAGINSLMKQVCELYSRYLIDKQSPRQILAQHPELTALWEGDPDHQYGRPIAFYQQLQDLDLMAAWSRVNAPTLALHGEFDWIMSRDDIEVIASLVNANSPGAAQFVELQQAGHTFEHYSSMQAAYAGERQPFETAVADRVTAWFDRHR